MKPFCSFICAVYNREKYLNQCLDSILSQTNQNFDLIIINDGSTDNSEKIILSYDDSRIKYHLSDHKGCWTAKNQGIDKATGEYLCFIDSDDFISSDYLQKAKAQIKINPLYDYYYPTALHIAREDGTLTDSLWRYISYPIQERQNLIKLFWERQIGGIPHAGAFIKKDVFERNGLYNDTYFNLSDTAYVIKNALNIRFYLLPELQFYYNRQHTNQTNTNFPERNRTFSQILDSIINDYPSEYFLGEAIDKNSVIFKEICVQKFMDLASSSNNDESYLKMAQKYLKMLRL